ncbi:MAG: arginine--tRNA ligase [Cyclobacteriaceae bacterium]|nr:arginine--tRNA ligase [Cyclobacteriaceae bacterium]
MNIEQILKESISNAFQQLYGASLAEEEVALQPTRKEFEGSHTLVCFPFSRISKQNPEATATALGEYLQQHTDVVDRFNVVKGFLNLVISDKAWIAVFNVILQNNGQMAKKGEVMVEYSSPNTNKPLHLGHMRNIFLGWSVSEILEASGQQVTRVQIINDRGIHICKSMVAWKRYGEGATPESEGAKGDKFIGNYYVRYDREFKSEVAELIAGGQESAEAERNAPIFKEAQDMLLKWEKKDPEVYALWAKMNGWVYEGFNTTYKKMGVDFDKLYYESDTYLLGREEVLKGVEKGVFYKKDDGSVWVDLTDDGLDEKLLLRSDGTSVYMTQDIGTAILRYKDHPNINRQIYTVGNEQEYHFKVLFLILDKLGYSWARECYHLSYGMVDLPFGKMKSREGTVVDADDLIDEVIAKTREKTMELGKIDELSPEEAENLYRMLGLGALKYYLLRVDPKKRILFNPEESVDLQGNTGPFIQYTHARISSLLRKADALGVERKQHFACDKLTDIEKELVYRLSEFPERIQDAAREFSPSVIAQYAYDLAREYNKLWQNVIILKEEDETLREFRVALSAKIAEVISSALGLLGIESPVRM